MKKNLTNSELSVIAGQLHMILHSGISSLQGLSIMAEDLPEGEGRTILNQVYEKLDMTGNFADALKKAEVFPEYFIKMTEVGERSGTLEEVMESLSSYYGRQDFLMKSIHDALVYPLILLGMLFAVLVVLITQVMPVFRQVFEQLGIQMTGTSSAVFGLSQILQNISIVLLVLIIASVLYIVISLKSETGRNRLLHLAQILPLGKEINHLLSCAKFTDALSLAIHSGLDIEESFTLACALDGDNVSFAQKTKQAHELVDQGQDLAAALNKAGIITGLNARMLSIGFHTGSSEDVLKQISVNCHEEADERLQNAVNTLEPTLTAVLSVLTGIILVSVMLPLLGVMTNIG